MMCYWMNAQEKPISQMRMDVCFDSKCDASRTVAPRLIHCWWGVTSSVGEVGEMWSINFIQPGGNKVISHYNITSIILLHYLHHFHWDISSLWRNSTDVHEVQISQARSSYLSHIRKSSPMSLMSLVLYHACLNCMLCMCATCTEVCRPRYKPSGPSIISSLDRWRTHCPCTEYQDHTWSDISLSNQ